MRKFSQKTKESKNGNKRKREKKKKKEITPIQGEEYVIKNIKGKYNKVEQFLSHSLPIVDFLLYLCSQCANTFIYNHVE